MLQKMSEIMEYSELLDKAAESDVRSIHRASDHRLITSWSRTEPADGPSDLPAALRRAPRGAKRLPMPSPPHRSPRSPPISAQDPAMRLMYVAAFAVGAYPSNERTYKPFNPILGETFEFETPSYFYVAEQAREWRRPSAPGCPLRRLQADKSNKQRTNRSRRLPLLTQTKPLAAGVPPPARGCRPRRGEGLDVRHHVGAPHQVLWELH